MRYRHLLTLLLLVLLVGCSERPTERLPTPTADGRYIQFYETPDGDLTVEAMIVEGARVRIAKGLVPLQPIGRIAELRVELEHCATVTFGQMGSKRNMLVAVPHIDRAPTRECQIGDWNGDWLVLRRD